MEARAPKLLYRLAVSRRFSEIAVTDYESYLDEEKESQFAAMTFSRAERQHLYHIPRYGRSYHRMERGFQHVLLRQRALTEEGSALPETAGGEGRDGKNFSGADIPKEGISLSMPQPLQTGPFSGKSQEFTALTVRDFRSAFSHIRDTGAFPEELSILCGEFHGGKAI